jgi:hypothetical protein
VSYLESTDAQGLDKLYEQAKSARNRFEPSWYLNLAYYQGDQWLFYHRGRLLEPALEPWRVTFTDNRILGAIRTEVAKMTKERPTFVATPRTSSEEDINAAQLAERVLDGLWLRLDVQRKRRAALLWSRICGAGFLKVYWDDTKGKRTEVVVDESGQPLMDENGRPMRAAGGMDTPGAQAQTVAEGDVCIEVRSPFEVVPDPLAGEEGISSAQWLIEETVHSKEYISERFGADLKADEDAIAGISESRMGGMGGLGGDGQYKGVKIRELWVKPGPGFPEGRYVVWAQGQVLKDEPNPYKCLPYVMFSGIPVPGRFWPTSMAEQLRPVQTELNKTKSQIRENASRIGNPALLKSRLANVEYSGLPGEEILFDDTLPNSVPSYLQAPELPAYVREEVERIEQSIREISGQHEVTGASVPSGVTAASAINLLQEADDTRLAPDIEDMESALAELGSLVLKLVADYYSEQRTIQLAGEDGEWDIFEFKGSFLGEQPRVEVQAGSTMPRSKAAKQAAMQDLFDRVLQYGVDIQPRDMRRFFREFEVGGLERMFGDLSNDEKQINDENRRLFAGEQIPLHNYDNDQLHITGHRNFQKSAKYRNLDPGIAEQFELHVAAHEERMALMMQMQMEQQAQMQLFGQEQGGESSENGGTLPSKSNGGKGRSG